MKVDDSLLSASDDADGEISCEEEEPRPGLPKIDQAHNLIFLKVVRISFLNMSETEIWISQGSA